MNLSGFDKDVVIEVAQVVELGPSEDMIPFVTPSQYYGCREPGIYIHGMDIAILEYYGLSIRKGSKANDSKCCHLYVPVKGHIAVGEPKRVAVDKVFTPHESNVGSTQHGTFNKIL